MKLFPVQERIKEIFFQHNPRVSKIVFGQRSGKTVLINALVKEYLRRNIKKNVSIVVPYVEAHKEALNLGPKLYSDIEPARLNFYSKLCAVPEAGQLVVIEEFLWSRFDNAPLPKEPKDYTILAVSSLKSKTDLETHFDGTGLEVCLPTAVVNTNIRESELKVNKSSNQYEQFQRDYLCYGEQVRRLDGQPIDI